MTRINCIPPTELTDKHLVAEYRELSRLFSLIEGYAQRIADGVDEKPLPPVYTLGKGHVRFFYDKAVWLAERQTQLVEEMLRRGFDPKFRYITELLSKVPEAYRGYWHVTTEAQAINRERIRHRLEKR